MELPLSPTVSYSRPTSDNTPPMASTPRLDTQHISPSVDMAGGSGEYTPTTDVVNYKSRGLGIFHNLQKDSHKDEEHSGATANALAGSWWGPSGRPGSRPWHNSPKRRKTIPPDQELAYERTKGAMIKVAASFSSHAVDVGIEALRFAADVLELAPVVGLAEAAHVLLSIWEGVQFVETNRLSCLRLTERCATILYSVRSEINASGQDVADILREPMERLIDSFRRVEHFVQKQVSRPFLKRYLKREEDAWKISACDASLTDSVGLFSVAIQLRTLREIRAQTRYFQHPDVPAQPEPHEIVPAIAAIRAAQAAHDSVHDVADLYAAMRAALRVGSDVAMLDVLQINQGEMQEAIKTLQRALEDPRLSPGRVSPQRTFSENEAHAHGVVVDPATPSTSSEGSHSGWTQTQMWGASPLAPAAWDHEQDAAFHREFLETGLDALRRLSGTSGGESLPPWTITRWEVDREGKIGMGYFSDVYKGTWRGRQVAIKILAPSTPRKLFRHETAIWASLKHTHVLELLGASSATGDPPWFFVSPYLKNGTVVSFLKAIASGELGRGRRKIYPGPLHMMQEIAVGMAYLHKEGVLHGDLKANNVLIDDELHCVISDFGQSELRSEVYRLSHRPQPHGTLRWQAPEILSGESTMTPEADVYAFAIVCVEILTNGELPWALLDDQAVQQLVLRNNKRPKIPLRPETSLSLVSLIEQCWSTDPSARPLFDIVAQGLGFLVGGLARSKSPSPHSKVLNLIRQEERKRSPDMAPIDLPDVSPEALGQDPSTTLDPVGSSHDVEADHAQLPPSSIPLQRVVTPSLGDSTIPPITYEIPHEYDEKAELPTTQQLSPTASSIFTDAQSGRSESDGPELWDGYESPPPRDARVAATRDERRYRLLLQHNFHPTLNLPLWEPSPVRLGAVGYLSKPSGRFVTLFNSFNPTGTLDNRVHGVPSLYGYGAVREATTRVDRRNIAQIGYDMIQGLLTFKKGSGSDSTFSRSVRKRYSYNLRAGHKHAYLCAENATYRYMVDMDAAKAWFMANVQKIVRLYGIEHNIQREDVYLVIGTLETRDYGLFVSHEHPDGQVHFNVYTDRRIGQDWGSFSTDSDISLTMPGPEFNLNADTPTVASVHATKISQVHAASDPQDAVLLARLRFKPDEDEPTRL